MGKSSELFFPMEFLFPQGKIPEPLFWVCIQLEVTSDHLGLAFPHVDPLPYEWAGARATSVCGGGSILGLLCHWNRESFHPMGGDWMEKGSSKLLSRHTHQQGSSVFLGAPRWSEGSLKLRKGRSRSRLKFCRLLFDFLEEMFPYKIYHLKPFLVYS